MDIFNLTLNCSQTALVYNAWHSGTGDFQALLSPLRNVATNVTDAFLEAQLDNQSFVRSLLRDAGRECQEAICSSLSFTGNADIAGIGVSVLKNLSPSN